MFFPFWRQLAAGGGDWQAATYPPAGGTSSDQTAWVTPFTITNTSTWGDAMLVAPPTITHP